MQKNISLVPRGVRRAQLFLISIVILFLELLLIRWLGTEINIFAYLQNAILICCFLGLGMGCLLPRKHTSLATTCEHLAIFSFLLAIPLLQNAMLSLGQVLTVFHDFPVWNEIVVSSWMLRVGVVASSLLVVFLLAGLVWRMMVPLGATLADLIDQDESPILAYSINIAGSLVGIWLFALLAYFSSPPYLWFFIFAALILPLIRSDHEFGRRGWASLAATLVFALTGVYLDPNLETKWSPYQKLEISKLLNDQEFYVEVNNTGYQQIQNNSLQYARENFPELVDSNGIMSQYDVPGRLAPFARDALIVGAGAGNDVAGLLRTTDADITAVEIDPTILEFGRRYHPENPYASSRVKVIIDDARAVFTSIDKQFDLIVFGLLDSHSTPAMTNARLDHFVYTLESFKAASKLLKPGGIFVVIFQPQRTYVIRRLAQALKETFGEIPLTFDVAGNKAGWGGVTFVSGSKIAIDASLAKDRALREFIDSWRYSDESLIGIPTTPTTDNWPYLYLEKPSFPTLFILLGAMLLGLWFISARMLRIEGFKWKSIVDQESLSFLTMGAGFCSLEVWGVNQCAILFGMSWLVNSVVISAVLLMILAANLIAAKFLNLINCRLVISLLILELLMIFGVNVSDFLSMGSMGKALVAVLLFGSPMLLSGLCFARMFSQCKDRGKALGVNLFGALIGGALQLITFLYGINSLLLVAIFFYIGVLTTLPRQRRDSVSA